MKRSIRFRIDNDRPLENDVMNYFEQAGFKCIEKNGNELRFKQSSGFLDSWIFNPLKWKSVAIIHTHEQKIETIFDVNTLGQIVTLEVKHVWNTFINNFKLCMIDNTSYKPVEKTMIEKAKKSIWLSIVFTLTGGITGGVIGLFLSRHTGFSLFTLLGVVVGANCFMGFRLHQNKHLKNSH